MYISALPIDMILGQLEGLISRRNQLFTGIIRAETSQSVIKAVLNGTPLQGVPRHRVEPYVWELLGLSGLSGLFLSLKPREFKSIKYTCTHICQDTSAHTR